MQTRAIREKKACLQAFCTSGAQNPAIVISNPVPWRTCSIPIASFHLLIHLSLQTVIKLLGATMHPDAGDQVVHSRLCCQGTFLLVKGYRADATNKQTGNVLHSAKFHAESAVAGGGSQSEAFPRQKRETFSKQ
jgi:hypothetical protein